MGKVRIGTSGWNYPTGRRTWNGVFYPTARGRPKAFDELAYYAEHFDTVEVNSTFYGQPRAEVTRGWANRTPAGFEFSVKLHQKFTHPRMFEKTIVKGVGEATPTPDAIRALAQPNAADIDQFRRGIAPLADAGKSVANATMIKRQLGEPIEGEWEPVFAERYPELAGDLRVKSEEFALEVKPRRHSRT